MRAIRRLAPDYDALVVSSSTLNDENLIKNLKIDFHNKESHRNFHLSISFSIPSSSVGDKNMSSRFRPRFTSKISSNIVDLITSTGLIGELSSFLSGKFEKVFLFLQDFPFRVGGKSFAHASNLLEGKFRNCFAPTGTTSDRYRLGIYAQLLTSKVLLLDTP